MRSGLALAGLLAFAAPVMADDLGVIAPDVVPQRIPAPRGELGDLAPRKVIAKKPAHIRKPRDLASRLTVKFIDDAKVRAGGGQVQSLTATDIAEVHRIADEFGVTFTPVITLPDQVVEAFERRAAFASRHAQPDFRGVFWVDGNENQIEDVANALNALGVVEFAHFTVEAVKHGGPGPLAPEAASAAVGAMGPAFPPPNLAPFQKYQYLFFDQNGNNEIEVFGLDDDPATLDDNEFYGGFDLPTAYGWGEYLIDEDLTVPGWDRRLNGARGATMRVGVIEFNAQVGPEQPHYDLRHIIVEPGQELFPHVISEKDHGTATLGEIAAMDHGDPGPEDEKGCVGMVPDAEPWFFPTHSVSHPGGRMFDAFISAYTYFDRGDVLSASIGFPPGPLVTNPLAGLIIQSGSDLGIITVMSAGNSCFNHDDFEEWPAGDGDGVIVGAGWGISPIRPDLLPFSRNDFSNHYFEETGVRVHCQGWGSIVVTCGYGDFYTSSNPNNRRYYYTNTFGGTSAAAPMIASTAVSLQGLAKMFFGIPLTPTQIRGLLESGFLQEGVPPICVSGVPDGFPCAEPFFLQGCPPEETDPDLVGPRPTWNTLANDLFTGSWFDLSSPIIYSQVLVGNHIYGNDLTLRVAEGNAMLVEAVFNPAGRKSGTDPFPAPTYTTSAYTTDIGVIGKAPGPPNQITSATVTISGATENNVFPLVTVSAYNREFSRWDMIGSAPGLVGQFPINQPMQYFDDNGEVMVRVTVISVGFGSGQFLSAYDLVGFNILTGGFGGNGD